jgi:hypothetical protein
MYTQYAAHCKTHPWVAWRHPNSLEGTHAARTASRELGIPSFETGTWRTDNHSIPSTWAERLCLALLALPARTRGHVLVWNTGLVWNKMVAEAINTAQGAQQPLHSPVTNAHAPNLAHAPNPESCSQDVHLNLYRTMVGRAELRQQARVLDRCRSGTLLK